MALFSVRIQLHHADSGDYYPLWQALEKLGFIDRAPSGGKMYALPSGVYIFEGEKSGAEVCTLARTAAAKAGHEAKILVTESKGMWSFGLEEYKTDDEQLKELFRA